MKTLHTKRRRVRTGGGRPPAESHIILEIDDVKEVFLKELEDFLKLGCTNPADAHATAERFRVYIQSATIMISRHGTIQISYKSVKERNMLLEFLRDNLVSMAGESLNLDPVCLNPFYRNLYLKMQKEIRDFFDELWEVERSWSPGANERALSESFPPLSEILERSMHFLKKLILRLIKEGVEEMIQGERPLAQIESEYIAMMQGIVYELAGEVMAECFHLEKRGSQ